MIGKGLIVFTAILLGVVVTFILFVMAERAKKELSVIIFYGLLIVAGLLLIYFLEILVYYLFEYDNRLIVWSFFFCPYLMLVIPYKHTKTFNQKVNDFLRV